MEITTIWGAVVLVIIVGLIFCYYKFCVPKDSDREKAMQFIRGFNGVFDKIISKVIEEVDITKYATIEEFESDIFAIAYNECWKYIEDVLQQALSNSSIGKLIAKCITQDTVEEYIRNIISGRYLTKVESRYIAKIEQHSAEAEEEDLKYQYEADLYETGEMEVEPYVEPEEEDHSKELNPQTDEEGEYSSEDNSQEIVEENSTEVINFDNE